MTIESLSYYQQQALNLIAKNQNEPTEAEIQLAKRFTNYGQADALRVLGIEQAELALTFNSESGQVLAKICQNKDGSYRSATEADIALARKFTDYGQIDALRVLGTEQALEFSYPSGRALATICQNKDGSYRSATEADIALARKFTDYGQIDALRVLGIKQAELALTFNNESGLALATICQNKDGSYRSATEADIALARKFTDYGQIDAFRVLGTEQALEFSYPSGRALSVICKNKDGSYREATEADIALAKTFTDHAQANAFEILGVAQSELALTFTTNPSSEALRAISKNQDGSNRVATEADIALAKEFKLESQADALTIVKDAKAALKFIYNTQVNKLKEYGADKFEQALTDGENVVKELDVNKFIDSITQVNKQYNLAEKLCQYHDLFANKESCLSNKSVLKNNQELENAIPDSKEMDALAEEFADVTLLNNPAILTSENPEDEIACTIIPAMFNALCSGDINTEL